MFWALFKKLPFSLKICFQYMHLQLQFFAFSIMNNIIEEWKRFKMKTTMHGFVNRLSKWPSLLVIVKMLVIVKIYIYCSKQCKGCSVALMSLKFESRFVNTDNGAVRHEKTLISLGICSVWSESDPSLYCPHVESFDPWLPTERSPKTMISLGGCTCLSESTLGAPTFCWILSCHCSYFILFTTHHLQHNNFINYLHVTHR